MGAESVRCPTYATESGVRHSQLARDPEFQLASARSEAGILSGSTSGVGRSATDSRPGSCRPARRTRDRRHPANLDPLRSLAAVRYRAVKKNVNFPTNERGRSITFDYKIKACKKKRRERGRSAITGNVCQVVMLISLLIRPSIPTSPDRSCLMAAPASEFDSMIIC
jgi:hypothetical protein